MEVFTAFGNGCRFAVAVMVFRGIAFRELKRYKSPQSCRLGFLGLYWNVVASELASDGETDCIQHADHRPALQIPRAVSPILFGDGPFTI